MIHTQAMIHDKSLNWTESNQRYLLASLKVVQQELELHYQTNYGNDSNKSVVEKDSSLLFRNNQEELNKAGEALQAPSALDRLVTIFGFSDFERKILLMCAGVELDAGFNSLVASLNRDPTNSYPTFSLALGVFPEAHWSAVSPQSPLRYWRLLEIDNKTLITKSSLKINESILHYLTGVQYLDEQLNDLVEPLAKRNKLVPSQITISNDLAWACRDKIHSSSLPILQLKGPNNPDKKTIAADVCEKIGFHLYSLSSDVIPTNSDENRELIRLWNRESALKSCALYLDCNDINPSDKSINQALSYFVDRIQGLLILSISEHAPAIKRSKMEVLVPMPSPEEQSQLWNDGFNEWAPHLENSLPNIVTQFNLSAHDIYSISSGINVQNLTNNNNHINTENGFLAEKIWKACCNHTRPKLDQLIERIEPVASWNEIVLPQTQKQILKELVIQVKQRNKVYYEWGFSKMGSRGLGISALFTGESGTGKTMASEVLANELQLDLYKIDLSQVVNKYIGETEKNLKRIFDAAEEGGAILLFDEADALFGKRSDVKDSHDRYSNIEVSYLLQRMETYRGLAILTTNMKSAIDTAFLRRIRFVVNFSYPDQINRAEIWRRIFPLDTPQKELDFEKLSRLNVPGGNIRNIALNAAFLAANENIPVQMQHILQAARSEYIKLEKSMSSFEIKEWV